MNTFKARVMTLKSTIKPADTATLIARHDRDGRQVIEHPACNATLARIRAARMDPRNWPPRAA